MVGDVAAPSVDVAGALSDMLRAVLLFLPKALAFLAILVVGWLVARLLMKAVNRVLERVGFDRAVERGGVGAALSRSRYDASDLVAKLVYYGVLLFTLQLAFGIWGPNPVSDLIGSVVAWLPQAFVAVIIVVVAAAIAGAVRDIIANALSGLSYGRLLANVVSWFIIGLGVIAALNQVGVATAVTTPILIAVLATITGILVVGVGGGLVRPMQRRLDGWLDRAAEESKAVREHARAYSAGQSDAHRAMAGEPAYAGSGGAGKGRAPGPAPAHGEPGHDEPVEPAGVDPRTGQPLHGQSGYVPQSEYGPQPGYGQAPSGGPGYPSEPPTQILPPGSTPPRHR